MGQNAIWGSGAQLKSTADLAVLGFGHNCHRRIIRRYYSDQTSWKNACTCARVHHQDGIATLGITCVVSAVAMLPGRLTACSLGDSHDVALFTQGKAVTNR